MKFLAAVPLRLASRPGYLPFPDVAHGKETCGSRDAGSGEPPTTVEACASQGGRVSIRPSYASFFGLPARAGTSFICWPNSRRNQKVCRKLSCRQTVGRRQSFAAVGRAADGFSTRFLWKITDLLPKSGDPTDKTGAVRFLSGTRITALPDRGRCEGFLSPNS